MSDTNNKKLSPETLILHKGFDPELSVGAVVSPLYANSTYVFSSAKEGERAFELAFFPERIKENESPALIYSRVNHPNAEILENRLCYLEPKIGEAAVFGTGMSAISTTVLALLPRNKTLVYTNPVYGGTNYFFNAHLPTIGCKSVGVETNDLEKTKQLLHEIGSDLGMLYLETPANPTLAMTDISEVAKIAKNVNPDCIVAIDNTFFGIFQQPFSISPHVDLIIYSATKFLGGHATLVGGVTLVRDNKSEYMKHIKGWRTSLGSIASPFVCWQLETSIKTYTIRMESQAKRAEKIAKFLLEQPQISNVQYPALLKEGDPDYEIYKKQCLGPGSIITVELKNATREKAFNFLNEISKSHVISLAVSLGGVETLVEHPASMTHSEVSEEELQAAHITDGTIRLSIGLENPDDIINILKSAFENYERG